METASIWPNQIATRKEEDTAMTSIDAYMEFFRRQPDHKQRLDISLAAMLLAEAQGNPSNSVEIQPIANRNVFYPFIRDSKSC